MYNPVAGSYDQEIIWCVSDESQAYTCTMAPIIGEDCQTRPAAAPRRSVPDHDSSRTRKLARPAVAVIPLTVVLALAGCSSSDNDEPSSAGDVTYPTVPFTAPGEGISLGHDDQEIGDTIPEPLHVGSITPIAADRLLGVEGGFGQLELSVNVTRSENRRGREPNHRRPGYLGSGHSRIRRGFRRGPCRCSLPRCGAPEVHAAQQTSPSAPTRETCSNRRGHASGRRTRTFPARLERRDLRRQVLRHAGTTVCTASEWSTWRRRKRPAHSR